MSITLFMSPFVRELLSPELPWSKPALPRPVPLLKLSPGGGRNEDDEEFVVTTPEPACDVAVRRAANCSPSCRNSASICSPFALPLPLNDESASSKCEFDLTRFVWLVD